MGEPFGPFLLNKLPNYVHVAFLKDLCDTERSYSSSEGISFITRLTDTRMKVGFLALSWRKIFQFIGNDNAQDGRARSYPNSQPGILGSNKPHGFQTRTSQQKKFAFTFLISPITSALEK